MRDRSEVRSPTRTEVRSPTRTSTYAKTRGNFTATVTGGAGAGPTSVTINAPGLKRDTGYLMNPTITVVPSDTGYMRGPSDAAGLISDNITRFKNSLSPTDSLQAAGTVPTYIGLGAILGFVAGKLAFKKHAILAGAAGGIGGYFYGSNVAAKAGAK